MWLEHPPAVPYAFPSNSVGRPLASHRFQEQVQPGRTEDLELKKSPRSIM